MGVERRQTCALHANSKILIISFIPLILFDSFNSFNLALPIRA